MSAPLAIEIGARFGLLTVAGIAQRQSLKRMDTVAEVICDCGTRKTVFMPNLRSGSTVSCGCQRGKSLRKHGLTGTAEHRAWCGMMTRCYWSKPGDHNYDIYRGAGVVVAERWHDFTNFLADMGQKPSSKHSLDRHPNASGNYEQGNARWATAREQANNWATRNKKYSLNGEILTEAQWARRIGISGSSLRERIARGWTLESALTILPIRNRTRGNDGRFANE